MKKKIIIGLVIFLVGLTGFGIIFKNQLFPKSFPPQENSAKKPAEKFNFEWTEWQDPAGFAFEYPKTVELDSHPADETNYAFLELTAKDKAGKITITVNDSQYTDVDEWLENDELAKTGSSLETEIASTSARKVALEKGREVAAFIDWDQVIYLVDCQAEDQDFWQSVYQHILSSFKLIPLEDESEEDFSNWLKGFDTSGADVVEPLEIIE